MSQVLKCDSCGREMDPKENFWKIDERYTDGYGEQKDLIAGEYDFGNHDFCTECIKLINRFITMPTEEKRMLLKGENILVTGNVKPMEKPKRKKADEAAESDSNACSEANMNPTDDSKSTSEDFTQAAVETPPKAAAEKKIDEGKVMALYRAGGKWDFDYIAEEMDTDADTIRMIVLKHQRKNMKISE
jgi:hypothetical protein